MSPTDLGRVGHNWSACPEGVAEWHRMPVRAAAALAQAAELLEGAAATTAEHPAGCTAARERPTHPENFRNRRASRHHSSWVREPPLDSRRPIVAAVAVRNLNLLPGHRLPAPPAARSDSSIKQRNHAAQSRLRRLSLVKPALCDLARTEARARRRKRGVRSHVVRSARRSPRPSSPVRPEFHGRARRERVRGAARPAARQTPAPGG